MLTHGLLRFFDSIEKHEYSWFALQESIDHPELGYLDIHPLISMKTEVLSRLTRKVAGISLKQNGFDCSV
jgi:hypothetical protein